MRAIFIVLAALLLTGCSMGRKSWGMATSADAFKVVLADPQSGSTVPELVAGGGCVAAVFAVPMEPGQTMSRHISYSRRRSLWNVFSSASASNVGCVYISGSDESAEETAKILEAFGRVVNGEADE
jgi:hypothetical protein